MTPPKSQDIYDIKPPLDWPGIHLGWIAILILVVILAGGILWWMKKQNKAKRNIVPQKTIWEAAYEQLEALEREDLLSKGNFKEYYSRLCDIIRHYIEERFNIRTCGMTTEEFLNFLRISPILSDQQKIILSHRNFKSVSLRQIRLRRKIPIPRSSAFGGTNAGDQIGANSDVTPVSAPPRGGATGPAEGPCGKGPALVRPGKIVRAAPILSHRNFKSEIPIPPLAGPDKPKFRCDPAKGGPKGDSARAKRVLIWQDFLNSCDLVKFAKHVPPVSEGGKAFQITKKFIEETK